MFIPKIFRTYAKRHRFRPGQEPKTLITYTAGDGVVEYNFPAMRTTEAGDVIYDENANSIRDYTLINLLPPDEAVASRAVFVIVSGSDGRTAAGNAFGVSQITQKR